MDQFNKLRGTKRVLTIIGMAIGGVIIAATIALILGFVVMWLWNWLMPAIFGLTKITFWQAWGLVLLSHILFKSFPHSKNHDHDDRWQRRIKEKLSLNKKDEPKQEAIGAEVK
jgi:positive regulator of sigma E activity